MAGLDRATCGYTVLDTDGIEEPCGAVATGWRWYQDVEHEDSLDVACDLHANEGGRRLHEAEQQVARVEALRVHWVKYCTTAEAGDVIVRAVAHQLVNALAGPTDREVQS